MESASSLSTRAAASLTDEDPEAMEEMTPDPEERPNMLTAEEVSNLGLTAKLAQQRSHRSENAQNESDASPKTYKVHIITLNWELVEIGLGFDLDLKSCEC